MTLPEGFTHLIAEDLKLEQIWKGVIEAPNPRALDMLLAKHLRTAGYTFSYSEVSAILENFQHGDRDRNGTYLQTILKSAGFKPDPQVSTLQDAAKVLPDIDFLWDPWLPNGFISLIAGKVGEGKAG